MPGVKISQLPVAPNATLSDFAPFVQNGVTSQESNAEILALFNANAQIMQSQVTGLIGTYLPLAGGTMTGNLILNANPTLPLQAATKEYADSIASGIIIQPAAYAATTVNLTATYVDLGGVGDTLTNSGTQAIFTVDGTTPPVNSRILVKNQTSTNQNGCYDLTNVGSVSTNWVLTRSTDYDTAGEITPGTLFVINNGTVNATTLWVETATVTTVGTDPILFSQFSPITGQFLTVVNNLSDLSSVAAALVNLGLGVPTGSGNVVLQTSPEINTPQIDVIHDTTNNEQVLSLSAQGAAVNLFLMNASATGVPVAFDTVGTDPNIAMNINSKGTSGVNVRASSDGMPTSSGYKGNIITSNIPLASAVSLTSATPGNITSITLPAGNWYVWGNTTFLVSVNSTQVQGWISSSSATLPDASLRAFIAGTAVGNTGLTVPGAIFNLSASTIIYLSAITAFTSGTVTGCGSIFAMQI